MEELTPKQIVEELNRYIVGQEAAKRAVAIALRNRHRRRMLPEEMRDEIIPKNILMIGPTGVGKTEIARRLAKLSKAPFVKVEASKFTEVGYVGRDVDSMIRDLVQTGVRMVETEKSEAVKDRAQEMVIERIASVLQPRSKKEPSPANPFEAFSEMVGQWQVRTGAAPSRPMETTPPTGGESDLAREHLRQQIRDGTLDAVEVEIEVEASQQSSSAVFSPAGMEEIVMNVQDMFGMMQRRKKERRMTIGEAKRVLAAEEARKLIDMDDVAQEAVNRVEQTGIVFLDELDKIAGRERGQGGPDVSREGVQRDILPIIEGSTVNTRYGPVRTDYILFIAAGAFHVSKPSDLIPELQGRLPIRVELESLSQANFEQILTEPKNALVKQYSALMATEGVTLEWRPDGVAEIARIAAEVNSQTENIGARRLHTVMERLLEELSFEAPDRGGTTVVVDAAMVQDRLASIVKDRDLSRFIL